VVVDARRRGNSDIYHYDYFCDKIAEEAAKDKADYLNVYMQDKITGAVAQKNAALLASAFVVDKFNSPNIESFDAWFLHSPSTLAMQQSLARTWEFPEAQFMERPRDTRDIVGYAASKGYTMNIWNTWGRSGRITIPAVTSKLIGKHLATVRVMRRFITSGKRYAMVIDDELDLDMSRAPKLGKKIHKIIEKIPRDADVVWLAYCNERCKELKPYNDIFDYPVAPACATAFIVSREFAEKFVRQTLPMFMDSASMMGCMFNNHHVRGYVINRYVLNMFPKVNASQVCRVETKQDPESDDMADVDPSVDREYAQLGTMCQQATVMLGKFSVISVAQCEALCDANKDSCTAIDTDGRTCFLRSTCKGYVALPNAPCIGMCGYRTVTSEDHQALDPMDDPNYVRSLQEKIKRLESMFQQKQMEQERVASSD
jgi:hypothetical protein